MAKWVIVTAACMVCLGASQAAAFDGRRSGFILGFGMGGGYVWIENVQPYDWKEGRRHDAGAFYTDLRFGMGSSDKLLIHYSGKQYFGIYSSEGRGQGEFWTLMFPTLGMTYFTKRQAPSPLLMAGIGAVFGYGAGFEDVGESAGIAGGSVEGGLGVYLGLGFEFAKGAILEANYGLSLSSETSHDVQQISLSLIYVGY